MSKYLTVNKNDTQSAIKYRNTTVFFALLLIKILVACNDVNEGIKQTLRQIAEEQARKTHLAVIDEYMRGREGWTTSNLGSIIFQNRAIPAEKKRKFLILMWKYWDWLKQRHVNRFGSTEHDPLKGCSVNNCVFTENDSKLEIVDAVVVHMQQGIVPHVKVRNPLQRWIFLNDESPNNVFSLARTKVNLTNLANVFNWSMTFRIDADVPVPYGRTVIRQEPIFKNFDTNVITEIIPNWEKKRRDVLATIVISNCQVKFRMDFIEELQKYISIDMFGGCSHNKTNKRRCPGHFRSNCEPTAEYLFYLSLENSNCLEYLTEKIWYQSYMKGAIPVILGPTFSDCKRLLPPNSFIYISMKFNATEIKDLANYITQLSENEDELLSLHEWRNHFKVLNEHGYFGTHSFHLCRLCEAMNYNDVRQKIYSKKDLQWFLDPKMTCDI